MYCGIILPIWYTGLLENIIFYGDVKSTAPGPYAGDGGGGCRANYFKTMQFFTRNWVNIPNFGLKIRIYLRFAPPLKKTLNSPPLFCRDFSAYISMSHKRSCSQCKKSIYFSQCWWKNSQYERKFPKSDKVSLWILLYNIDKSMSFVNSSGSNNLYIC